MSADTVTGPNHSLFVQVLAQIEREPQRWRQNAFATLLPDCGTAYCFAGWATTLSGLKPDFRKHARCLTSDGEPWQTNALTNGVQIEHEAEVLLGIDDWRSCELFGCRNTLDDLYRISADILGIDEQVLREKVAAEVADGSVQP